MRQFVDREREMKFLEEQYQRSESSFVILYGRRRVGKTTLVNEFCKGKRALYFLATQESLASNCQSFRAAVADFTGNPLLQGGSQFSWDALFGELGRFSEKERIVVVLDEFQYLGKADKAFLSILQKIWDTDLQRRNVMLIVCGSLVTLMEEQTLAYSSPLYGRRTGQLRLQQVPFRNYADFYEGEMSPRKLVEYYAVTGGIPKYVELFEPYGDIYEAIEHNVLDRSSFLYEEPQFLLQHEVSEVGTYFSIIKAIAAGNRKLSQIAGCMEVRSTDLTKPLQTLIGLDILEREVPITEEKPDSSKKGLYRIKDNFLAFWFRFVYPYRSLIESGHPEAVMGRIKKSLTDSHTAFVYEDVCRQKVWDKNAQGQFSALYTKVGRWWRGQEAEIDIVAVDTEGGKDILFGECKFKESVPMGANVLAELREKAKKVRWGSERRREQFILFSASGFSEALQQAAQESGDVFLIGE